MKKKNRSYWGNFMNSALVVAVIAATGSIGVSVINNDEDLERCRIATMYISDDQKDKNFEVEQEKLKKIYTSMAVRYCPENEND